MNRLPRVLGDVGFGLAVVLLILAATDLVVPARTGMLALSRVLAPYLALLFVPLGLLALLLRGDKRQRLGLVVAVGIALGFSRFLLFLPGGAVAADPGVPEVHLATWNLYLGQVPPTTLIEALSERAPAVVGLEELSPSAAAIIAADEGLRSLYPYQLLQPADDWTGMGLLSPWPFDAEPAGGPSLPPLIEATVHAPRAAAFRVFVVHPHQPLVRLGALGPTYDQGIRDASLQTLRSRLDESLAAGSPIVVMGDLNLTDREPAYGDLVAGLTDTYRAVGSGMGSTWRPPIGDGLPFGMLRIDMVLTGPGVRPLLNKPDCTPRVSDHCILDASVELPAD